MIISGPYARAAGREPAIGIKTIRHFAYYSFDKRIHFNQQDHRKYVDRAASLITGVDRTEVYLTKGHDIVAMVMYTDCVDIHYGRVAIPVTVTVMEEVRHNREVLRSVNQMIKMAVKALDCQYYYTVKHTAPGMQVHRLREV
ncbi:hypothetical protein BN110_041 [Yersinia phage phiR8-01]|uniref:Uncharacterized protein n=1 Tax=Yersinia phage phiR8-01 TaxID=1206556 RepID=I7J3S1_9CAUD|nr:host range and adsorption protein [Yersinia phage phiR8-01]CCI88413.2 hypothetical protein BN110_041 [Yersinia phage phiR8-01]